ncbi:hypothetical protein NUH86_12635 [Sphingobium sp. JS3065]|nr:hypothetical protein [Sphingobium sp. JS3065]UZW54356.1 hypothetical protein NUH86_12635 [Sphingobium sp. JS3065]
MAMASHFDWMLARHRHGCLQFQTGQTGIEAFVQQHLERGRQPVEVLLMRFLIGLGPKPIVASEKGAEGRHLPLGLARFDGINAAIDFGENDAGALAGLGQTHRIGPAQPHPLAPRIFAIEGLHPGGRYAQDQAFQPGIPIIFDFNRYGETYRPWIVSKQFALFRPRLPKNQIPNRIVLVVRWWCNLLQQSGT